MNDQMKKWEQELGVEFLRRIGVGEDQTILDFGCGTGHYTIPAALAVGERGVVYCVDKDADVLDKLRAKIKNLRLWNIKIIGNTGDLELDLESESIDMVLLYDMLHYVEKEKRKLLYGEVLRLLKPGGMISVYPKHVSDDYPLNEFANLSIDDVKKELENTGFYFLQNYSGTISHDDLLNEGCVLNFTKPA
jgi:ubiquinone/menaquinone biosynthesis C-methylase UbiE